MVAEITVEMIRILRERTGAGMMDVKRALQEANGDEEDAVRILREKGLAQAAKRAARRALEGVVQAHLDRATGRGSLIELNSETDFVAKTEEFRDMARRLAAHAAGQAASAGAVAPDVHSDPRAEASVPKVDALLALALEGDAQGRTAAQVLTETAARFGEHVRLRRFVAFEGGRTLDAYIHAEGRIGVLIDVEVSPAQVAGEESVRGVIRDLAMQIAAFRAEYVERGQVPEDVRQREREVYRAAALNEGKPERVVDRIVEGRLDKFYQEVCLLEQPFMRDPSLSVRRHLEQAMAPTGATLVIRRFARFERAEPLASEPAAEE